MASPAESSENEYPGSPEESVNGAAGAQHGEGEETENFQGPHKWRQNLRHVKAPKFENSDIASDITESARDCVSDRYVSNFDHYLNLKPFTLTCFLEDNSKSESCLFIITLSENLISRHL